MAAEAAATPAQLTAYGGEALGAQVGRDGALTPGPHAFDWVEFRGVGRKAMDGEPGALGLDVGPRLEAAVGVQAVPEQNDTSPDVATQVLQETNDLGGSDRTGVGHEEDAGLLRRSRSIGESADHREVVPASESVG